MSGLNESIVAKLLAAQVNALLEMAPRGPETHSDPAVNLHPYKIGKNYFIRTVTHHYTGRLEAVYPNELLLSSAAWIADDGRFADAVASVSFSEVEPYPSGKDVIIGRGAILDAVEIETLPTDQK